MGPLRDDAANNAHSERYEVEEDAWCCRHLKTTLGDIHKLLPQTGDGWCSSAIVDGLLRIMLVQTSVELGSRGEYVPVVTLYQYIRAE